MRAPLKSEGFRGQRLMIVPQGVLAASLAHPLLKHLCPTHAGFFPRARWHFRNREKGCGDAILIFCVQGKGWCQLGNTRHEINRDQLLIVPAGVPHSYGASEDQPWSIHFLHVTGENVPLYIKLLGATVTRPVVPLLADIQLLALFEDVLEGLKRGFNLEHLIQSSHALAHLMGQLLWQKRQTSCGQTATRFRVEQTIDFMKTHLREQPNAATLAAMVNLSLSQYRSLFRRITGQSPINYFIHLRIQRAVELLVTTDFSVKEIGTQLGYDDQFYFSRVFRSIHGESPVHFRQRQRT